jgi:hypothetical protein
MTSKATQVGFRDRRELQALADGINPPDFDPVENADQVRQRGEFTRLCRDLAALAWLTEFFAGADTRQTLRAGPGCAALDSTGS